jgi:hypothetical protein
VAAQRSANIRANTLLIETVTNGDAKDSINCSAKGGELQIQFTKSKGRLPKAKLGTLSNTFWNDNLFDRDDGQQIVGRERRECFSQDKLSGDAFVNRAAASTPTLGAFATTAERLKNGTTDASGYVSYFLNGGFDPSFTI